MKPPLLALLVPLAFVTKVAAEDDIFAFIPEGGRTILEALSAEGLPDPLANDIAAQTADADTWRGEISDTVGGGLDPWSADTLAAYLAANAPFDPAGPLPRDGRDIALAQCQSCHIITVVVTQDRTREAWLGTLASPSHIEIDLTDAEREELATYLVLNAGIPIDDVPPPLRAGGASY